jgi:hypothetical protein
MEDSDGKIKTGTFRIRSPFPFKVTGIANNLAKKLLGQSYPPSEVPR